MWLIIGSIALILVGVEFWVFFVIRPKGRMALLIPLPFLCLLIWMSFQLHFCIFPKEGCRSNLKQINDVLVWYAKEHDNCFPDTLLAEKRSVDVNNVLGIDDYGVFRCPQDAKDSMVERYSSYWYAGYACTREEELLACIDGAANSDPSRRLCLKIHAEEARIPVFIEIPRERMWHECHVLFLDGHIECMAPGTAWPLTEKVAARLRMLDASDPANPVK